MSKHLVETVVVATPPVVAAAAAVIDPTVVAAVAAVLTVLINGILAYLMARLNKKADSAELEARENRIKVEEIHKTTNSMKDAMVAAALKEGEARGVEKEKVRADLRAADVAKGRAEAVKEAAVAPAALAPAAAEPVPVKVVAAVPVPVKETPDKP